MKLAKMLCYMKSYILLILCLFGAACGSPLRRRGSSGRRNPGYGRNYGCGQSLGYGRNRGHGGYHGE
ncbi:hypothetical protein V1264_016222 [Littorina saxatilis]|uniref:Uncharacterized protein n=1 Tax=Littorina saxatilis TaxID=31220 RepID=A0AAN9BMT4_9CAEN